MLAHRLISFPPTRIGSWLIRGSIFKNDSICIVAFNTVTQECQIRYFLDENEAHRFVKQFSD